MRLINKILGNKKRRKVEGPALSWHAVHGDNIELSEDMRVAMRQESYCHSIVFSERALMVGEKIWMRLRSVSDQGWRGGLRFGVSGVSPDHWSRDTLPRYLCPDMTQLSRVWARAMPEKHVAEGNVVFFYIRSSGDLVWGVNGKEKGVLISGISVDKPLWAVVDVYGRTSSVEIVDPRSCLNNILEKDLKKNKSDVKKVILNQDILRLKRNMNKALLSKHCLGQNIKLSEDAQVASRSETEFCNGYVFLDSPMQPGESLVIRVLETEGTYIGSIAFGLTSADPKHLKSSELPEDSDLLSQRPEYWVHSKDVLPDPQDGDEISFTLSLDGAVLCSVNGGPQRILFYSDINLKTRAFIDIFGIAQKIQILGIKPCEQESKSCSIINHNITDQTSECVICYESDVDCVLYSCGHMCMCFQCAVQQWSQAGECPLCRAPIKDVIRAFRA